MNDRMPINLGSDALMALTIVLEEMDLTEQDFAMSEAHKTIAEIILRSFKNAGFSVEPADPHKRKARAEQDISVLQIANFSGVTLNGVNAVDPDLPQRPR